MKIRMVICVLSTLLLAACVSSAPPKQNAALESARTAVNSAAQDQDVQKYAPVELKKAKEALQKAVAANNKSDHESDVEYFSYMAEGHAKIADAKANAQNAEARAKAAEDQRSNLVVEARNQELKQRKSEIQELKNKLSELKPRQTDQGIVLTLGNVLFAFDSAALNAQAQEPLDKLASFLHAHTQNRLLVNGYTDSVGSASYNQGLSQRRAQSVADALIARGVNAGRMSVIGHGETNPVASNATAAGRQQNRRVEFVILNANGQQTGGSGASSMGGESSTSSGMSTQ